MDDDQQFCLRWNNHQSTLISVFDTLLEKGMHVDCTLAAEGQTLKAHKVVLSACSPYFEAVLSQQYDKHPIIILKDVKFAEMRAMMDYMYRGEVNISQDQLGALLKAAESLQIKGLSDSKPPAARSHSPASKQPRSIRTSPTLENNMSREGSISPTRRKKKKPRSAASASPTPLALTTPTTLNNNVNSHSNHENNFTPNKESTVLKSKTENTNDSNVELKSEFTYYGNESVEDLTMEEVDSETELTGAGTSHIIPHDASGLAWSMERSHDENMPEGNPQDVDDTLDIKAEKSTTADIPIMDLDEVFDGPSELITKPAILNLFRKSSGLDPALMLDPVTAVIDPELFIEEKILQNNNVIAEDTELKMIQKTEPESEPEMDDLDDILLPDESEVFGDVSVKSEDFPKRSGRRSGLPEASRQFECRHCGKRYRWKSTLRRHETVECGGKAPSHACPYCVYRAKQRGNLGVHIRKHHNAQWNLFANTKLRKNKKVNL